MKPIDRHKGIDIFRSNVMPGKKNSFNITTNGRKRYFYFKPGWADSEAKALTKIYAYIDKRLKDA